MDRDDPASAAGGPGLETDLVAWGKVLLLETRGRSSGIPRRVAVGFLEEPDGGFLVSAAGEGTHWARNLIAEPRCRVSHDGLWLDYVARALDPDDHRAIVTALILKYGTPAERLGEGPSFRLEPLR